MSKVARDVLVNYLRDNQFVDGDMKQDMGDTSLSKYCTYLMRVKDGKYAYALVVTYDNLVVEVVGEVYLAKKNTFKPKGNNTVEDLRAKGFLPVRLSLLRTFEEVKSFVESS